LSKQPKRKPGNLATDDDYAFSSWGRRFLGISPQTVKEIKKKTNRKERRAGKEETRKWNRGTENV